MKFKETGDPDILETKSGGGFLMLFGLPFLLAGLFIITTPLELFPLGGDDAPWYFVVPFGAVFTLIGAGLMFGRRGVIIDRRQKTVTTWYGIFVPMKQTQHYIDTYRQLTVTREIRRGDKSSYTVYPIRLKGGPVSEEVNLGEPRDYHEARYSAESIARFLKMPIADSSSGEKVIRDADKLDESIRERARRTGEKIKIPGAPFDTKVKVRQESGEVIVEIPPAGITPFAYLKLAIQLIFMATIISWFILPIIKSIGAGSEQFLFFGLIGLVFILIPLIFMLGSVLTQARKTFFITASRHILRVVEKTPFKKKTTEIPADELEELAAAVKNNMPEGFSKTPDGRMMIDKDRYDQKNRSDSNNYRTEENAYIPGPKMASVLTGLSTLMPHSKGIVARSDRETIQFGSQLSEAEMNYVHAVIKKAMTE